MILREIPREYEAVKYEGDKTVVEKFVARHGGRIEFPEIEGLEHEGTLHTAQGTEKVTPGVWVVSDAQDQLSRISPKEIGVRFEIIDPNADRLELPPTRIPPEPKVSDSADDEGDDDDFEYDEDNFEESDSGLVLPAFGPKTSKRFAKKNEPSPEARLDKVEATLDKIVELLSQ